MQSVVATSGGLTRLFAALALALVPVNAGGGRTHWVAGGLLTLGVGHLAFGFVEPALAGMPTSPDVERYEALFVRIAAAAFFAVGLFPDQPPRLSRHLLVTIAASLIIVYVGVFEHLVDRFLPLPTANRSVGDVPSPATPLFWMNVTLGPLAMVALAGALRQSRRSGIRGGC